MKPDITIHLSPAGKVTLVFPKGYLPDRETLENVSQMIRMLRKEAVA